MKHKDNSGRLFIVGAPRSGTTLLQSLLAAHPEITSFPESHAFENLTTAYQRRWKLLQLTKIASPVAVQKLYRFLDRIGYEAQGRCRLKYAFFSRQYALGFVEILDEITRDRGKSIWVEKTPQHINCISYIEGLNIGAKFIHLVRNGTDVVASQYDAGLKNSDTLWRVHLNLDKCIDSWKNDVQISLSHSHKPNHILISYERLANSTEAELIRLCQFIGVPFNSAMLQDYALESKELIMDHEANWKNSLDQPIQNANGMKFSKLFNKEQQAYILEALSPLTQELVSLEP
ncbi:sulfotransferase [Leptolyngbya sp. BC1307]|uniref:sulfotransferase family protein n=1 Tax=Leptolyngbya sp. BC1307 TaxID=2029589 RepID=UPI000EFAEE10|nr:sulfotransferase [Leptolyngbya sp. BC1307]